MNIEIRKAVAADYPEVKRVLDESDRTHLLALPSLFRDPGAASWAKDYVIRLMEDENSEIFIALADGNIAGVMVLIIKHSQNLAVLKPRSFVALDSISIPGEFQGKGIGTVLLKRMEDWAREKKIYEIELNVYEFNERAVALYERLEFKTQSRRMLKVIGDGN